MYGIEFTILKLGEVENDRALNLAGLNWGTVDNKHPEAVWFRLSSIAILVKHPQAGYILYDTGNYLGNDDGTRIKTAGKFGATYMKREDYVDMQLQKVGLTVDDVDMIILSHGHADHMGGLGFFSGTKAGQNVYIARKEFEAGLLASHKDPKGHRDAYFKGDYEFPDIKFHLIEEEGEFLPGIELVFMEGHTPGCLAMMVHCDGGTYIFPSDAIYTERNYGPPVVLPGLVSDTLGFYRSIKKVNALEKKYNAKFIYPHDLEQLNRLKIAPYFYK